MSSGQYRLAAVVTLVVRLVRRSEAAISTDTGAVLDADGIAAADTIERIEKKANIMMFRESMV